MVRHAFFQNSQCLNGYLHRFEIKEEYGEGVLEVCEICKGKKFFKIIDGKLNNDEYMSYHFRNVIPPSHPYHYHEHEYDPFEGDKIISPYAQ